MIRLILYIIPESKYRKFEFQEIIWKYNLKRFFVHVHVVMTVRFTRPALSRSGSISACNIYNLNKMPHFLLSKYEISQVSVGGKGSAIEIYWKNQRGYGKFIWWARATIISRATVRWIPLKVLNPTPRFKTRAHFLTNLFTQSHFLLKIWLPGIWSWSIF